MEPTQSGRSSVEISRNAKGDTQFSVKVYREPGEEVEAKDIADRIYRELQALYYPTLKASAD